MNILVLQETDWITRGPHTQHHVFERLSQNPKIRIVALDYDIDKIMKSDSVFIKKQIYTECHRTIGDSNIKIIRTAHLQVPFLRRISSLVTNIFQILQVIRHKRPDLIVGFSITNGFIGLLLSKIFRIPFLFYTIDILHTLVPILYVQGLARTINRFLLKYSDHTIVVTKFLQSYLLNEGVPKDRISLLFNGISLENTVVNEQKLSELKHRFAISNNDFVLFFMGYLYDFAGLKEIIDYYHSDIKQGKLNLKFLILGDGGIYNSLKNHIEQLNADWVILAGRVPFFEITEYIELADLCILSFEINEITREITPIKIIEYMAMQKPVLSTALPGVVNELGEESGVIFALNQKELVKQIGKLPFKILF